MKKKYLLVFATFLCSFFGFTQVSENFDGWTDNSYGGVSTYSSVSGNWETNNSICNATNARSGNGIRFNDDSGENEYLLYSGLDGNGKDNGIGTISFWYRHWDGDGSNVEFQTQYSLNGGTSWVNIGSVTNVSLTAYTQFSNIVDLSADNILIRVISIDDQERLMIDDFEITDYTVTTDPSLGITGTSNHGSSCISTAATSIQYTIGNSGSLTANGINVTSDNVQFVVSGLSSTSITAGGTATFDVTFTPSSVGAQTAEIEVTSTTATSNSPTINLTGTGITSPSITTQPTNQNEIIPNTATFSLVSSDATSYQWQVDTGSGWNNVSTGTGGTTNSYTTAATNAAMNNNQYRCIVTNSCGDTNSNSATLTLTNNSPNNVTGIRGCFEDTSVILDWNPPATGTTPDGYIVFARTGGTDPFGVSGNASTYNGFNTDFSIAPTASANLGRYVYKGNATTSAITGLTEDDNYSFTVFAYVGETLTGWASGGTGGSTVTNGVAQGDVRNLVPTPLTNQVTLNWLNPLPTSCWDDVLIVANQGPVVFTPSGDGSAYIANPVYSGANQVVYKGNGNVVAVTSLTNGTNYCFRAYIRRGTTWTAGVEVCAVPSLTYCNAGGNTSFDTGITGVTFNTINNTGTTPNNSYTNYTAISTDVNLGASYNLGVVVNIDGAVDVYTRVWIDWNQNGSFNDSGEEYDLGMDTNPNTSPDLNTATSNSPISVEIPTNATIGATRMRVFTQYNSYPTSCATGTSGEAEDYTINVIQPANAEINIKGNNITIPDGFNAPYGLNNTLFASTTLLVTTAPKVFEIQNIGLANLTLTGAPRVEITGVNPGDFNVSVQPPSATLSSNATQTFQITFTPTADGVRTATVSIANSDSDENPYTFDIQGTGVCSTTLTSTLSPVEGPINTEVTITSATDLSGATATINGLVMPIVSSSATELVVSVPVGATSGNISVLFSNGCSSTNTFTVIDILIGGCETGASSTVPLDLFISEISDATSGSHSLIEIFNGTAASVNLANYNIRIYNNNNTSPTTDAVLSGTLVSGGVYVISVGTTSCDLVGNGLGAGLPNIPFNSSGGINFDLNSSDAIALYNSVTATEVDVFGVPGNDNWANGLVAGGDGVNFRRQNTAAALPSPTFILSDWDQIEWSTCGDSDYSDFGVYDFSLGIPPTVSALSAPMSNCTDPVQLSITATEGIPAGLPLVYQWYYLVPSTTNFVVVPDNADFDNVTTNTLDVLNPLLYADYQFYCQVRENGVTCFTASNVVKLNIPRTVWDGAWSAGAPDLSTIAVIDADYNTSIDNLQACNLIINASRTLTISNGDFVEVNNDITVNGNVIINSQGALIQNGVGANAGTYLHSGAGASQLNKLTAQLQNWYDYTYWSSPVKNTTVHAALAFANPNRRYQYNANLYLDTSPADDIDDDGNDWELVSSAATIMEPGRGYAATHNPTGFIPNTSYQYNFVGEFNTGLVTEPLAFNAANSDHWNFVGNPYPSALDIDELFNQNSLIKDVVYLWSHYRAPDAINPGNEVLNFSQDDYLTINATGEVGNGSDLNGDGFVNAADIPDRYIPSGQGFFVSSTGAGNLVFNNSMRISGANSNLQFFEANDSSQDFAADEDIEKERLWLNLLSDNGAANQLLVGYLPQATDGFDGMGYDAKRNLSTNSPAIIYTEIDGVEDMKFVIQAKNISSLNDTEVIPVGFKTSIDEATIYTFSLIKFEGEFLTEHEVYLKDNVLNTIHNLKESDYNFISNTGTFNDRFEIVFTGDTLSTTTQVLNDARVIIIERTNGHVWFKPSGSIVMDTIEIIDLQGRTIYNFKVTNNDEAVYNLSPMSNATYIAKVTLKDGRVIIKKDVKRY